MTWILILLAAVSLPAAAQISDEARIEGHGGFAVLSVNTSRPLDAIATKLESQFGIAVSAEDPFFRFRGDM
ncbi:MAG TPA: hypothetical protein VG345_14345, partial [Bryobacteraceae bacterium]|nr:hypothetical protein [Bryobacteraceae bacterium]